MRGHPFSGSRLEHIIRNYQSSGFLLGAGDGNLRGIGLVCSKIKAKELAEQDLEYVGTLLQVSRRVADCQGRRQRNDDPVSGRCDAAGSQPA